MKLYRSICKPLIDRAAALVILIVASPVLVLAWSALMVANRGSAWFIQVRPGYDAKPFRIIKFKTMNDLRDSRGVLLPDYQRLTRVGYWIRKTSIDELPQLLNVLRGDMSLVGPRPLLMEYLPLYNDFQRRRHEVKPGITGWAQVNGRNLMAWGSRFEFDVWYVDHQSFSLDLKILLKTIQKVLQAEGVASQTSVTMDKFNGNQ